MSFERNAASAERSLMDIFGPDASDDAKAITERAAQLSMDDMANILNAKKSSQNDLTNDLTVGANIYPEIPLSLGAVQWQAQVIEEHRTAMEETYTSENSKQVALMYSRPRLNALNRRTKKPFVKS
ncbi:hypothetical protein [Pectobacterium versatile]|uniref:hypothetical protein n=1 Tax=Pectobacterium versatile TaxID=2488639 RepID=UPI00102F2438|nr:hypothetical protein [Pectobacterium versatile]MBN3194620.1 hypothetical protein [Pectobacterium versatile]TAI97524.1 hypothetical protein EG335_10735 [Pectobacterium versatile]